jgi:hypothetical protein
MTNVSHDRTLEAGSGPMSAGRRVLRAVYQASEFNALLLRLPRRLRRAVDAAPPEHVGLVVQIVTSDDCTLTTVREHVPADANLPRELARLEAVARRELA